MKLLHKLLLIIFCAALIPIGLAAAFLSYYRSQSRSGVMALQQNVVQLAALMTEREMQDLSRRFDNLLVALPGSGAKDIAANISLLMEKNPEFLFLAIADNDGHSLYSIGDPEFVKLFGSAKTDGDMLFHKARETGRPAIGDFEYMFNLPACRIVYPYGKEMYAFAIVNLLDLAEKLEQQRLGAGGLMLADSEGNAILFSSAIEKLSHDDILAMAEAQGIVRIDDGISSDSFLVASAPVNGTSLRVIGVQYEAEAFSGLNSMSWLMAFLALAVSSALYFSAIIFAGQARRPIDELLAASKRVSDGDFQSPIEVRSQFRELSDLIDSFNIMMKDLKHYQDIHLDQIFDEKQKLEQLVGLISDAIFFCDSDGNIIYNNAPAMAIMREGWKDLSPDGIKDRIRNISKTFTEGDGSLLRLDINGEEKWYAANVRHVNPKTDSPMLFITMHDATLEKEMQQVKEDFFNSAAHDLRAPLLSMQGYIRLLSYTVKESKQKEYVSSLEDSSKRLFTLIENILDFSRLDADSFNINPQEILLSDFFDSVVEAFNPVFEDKGIGFVCENALPADTVFNADPDLVRRVIDNLLSNAAKFAPKDGKVSLTVEKVSDSLLERLSSEYGYNADCSSGKKLLFTVRDNGKGIPENMRTAVFEKYRQIRTSANTDGKKGFGLGLAICKRIIGLHGGLIWAESGTGGVFRFVI